MEKSENFSDDTICPNCLTKQSSSIKEDLLTPCVNCKELFIYLKCYHCKKKIYFKNQNYTDGVNIKCPFSKCGKWFSKSLCGVCERVIYFPDRYQEGSKVRCPFKDCEADYSKILCPKEKCGTKMVFTVPKEIDLTGLQGVQAMYKEGMIVACRSITCKTKYQKLNCYHCLRRLIWIWPNIMIEGQKIICPYDDCEKVFNKVYCPHCQKCNIFTKGGMEVGAKITCIYKECGKIFCKIFCPHCNRMNVFANGGFTEGVKTQCVYSNCNKTFSLVNCCHCKRVNIWQSGDYITGQNIICAYPDCKKKSAKINCFHCSKINVFPNGDYCFGKNYSCIYSTCQNEFTNFVCPGCLSCLNLKGKYLEGNKVVCGIPECKSSFINFRCPHCYQVIMDQGVTYKFGQTVICPYTTCLKKFNYLYCIHCRRGIYFKDNAYQEGQIVKCPYNECNKNFIFIYCSCCGKAVQFGNEVEKSLTSSDEIKCVYPTCSKKFRFASIHTQKWMAGTAFIWRQGVQFNYSNPMKEIWEMNVLLSLINMESVYKKLGHQMKVEEDSIQKKEVVEVVPISECTLCMSNPKESVFVPCGHRCACYPCALGVFKNFKKCPLCNQVSTDILKKVYD